MPPVVALVCTLFVVFVLLRIERTRTPSTSFALWLPLIWMFLAGSRPVSRWLDLGASSTSDGSLPDRVALAVMIVAALLIVRGRSIHWGQFVRDNLWLLVFFAYIGLSVLWTDVPFVALKRWIRSGGVIAVALIVLSEADPLLAFERILRRCAYALIPLSVVFIKYFPQYGREYGWSGTEMWTGVTTQKNSLGAMCAVSVVMIVMSFLRKRHDGEAATTGLQRGADLFIVVTGCVLLRGGGSYSATAIAVTGLGVAICAFLLLRPRGGEILVAHLRPVAVAAVGVYLIFWDTIMNGGAQLLGRRGDLTGRSTEIWPFVMEEAARHPVFGSGYGGVWGLGNKLSVFLGLEQAHNGYLDVYLQLGIVGCVLLALFLLEFAARASRQFHHERAWAVFGMAFLFMNLIYNLSETAFFDVYLGASLVMMSIVLSADGQQEQSAPAVVAPQTTVRVPVPATWNPALVHRLNASQRSSWPASGGPLERKPVHR